ncbi:MAG: cytochrome P450 [Gammaproteobacteria bacterium]|uniref:Cytochrome P450 n=1 Tax=OM182 bacterium TaxID=2510334 RepID=A0A520S3G2_9GAMM|nr:cytochrome P450 [Gammaproteobacteria bacterium]RZO76994.1 MAG: cytochrome P450 [OM182 bacterium]
MERLRTEAPVHWWEAEDGFGFWSLTRYEDIKAVDTNHEVFSSEPIITVLDPQEDFPLPMFIAMDPPKHDEQRKVVTPTVGPSNLARMESTIRERVCHILDSLPLDEEFNWVEKVSIELTTQMLATLFDFPFEDRGMLTRWSDVATSNEDNGVFISEEEKRTELMECLKYFTALWQERKQTGNGFDFISMLAHGEATQNMDPTEFLGNLILLIVGGNDTTRNSISGGVYALNKFPEEYAKLRSNPKLIPNMVAEIIRWQTPLSYMRRTVLRDTAIRGQKMQKGDRVLMWYASGNRDKAVFENADRLIIDRKNARQHLAFGFGIHRCMGNRLAEMQLRVLWEEIQKRFYFIEVLREPERIRSSFVRGYSKLPVKLHIKTAQY